MISLVVIGSLYYCARKGSNIEDDQFSIHGLKGGSHVYIPGQQAPTTITYNFHGEQYCEAEAKADDKCVCVLNGPVTLWTQKPAWFGCLTKLDCTYKGRGCWCQQTYQGGGLGESFVCADGTGATAERT